MAIITISRGSLSGGQALAEWVAIRLGYRCVSREVSLTAAERYGVPESKLSQCFDKPPRFWERLTQTRRLYLMFIQVAMCELAQEGDLVYHGRAGHLLLKGISHVLKVRLIAPLEYRIKAAMEREGLGREAALPYIQRADEERLRRMRDLFGVDWRDPALYDAVLNLEHMSLETAVDVVLGMGQRPEYQPTPASMKQLDDLTLSCQVQAALAVHPATSGVRVAVWADGGVVRVAGLVDSSVVKDDIIRVARAVVGVKKVINDLDIRAVYPFPVV